jgi:hypothetical protein
MPEFLVEIHRLVFHSLKEVIAAVGLRQGQDVIEVEEKQPLACAALPAIQPIKCCFTT